MFTQSSSGFSVRNHYVAAVTVALGLAAQASAGIVGSAGNIHGPYSGPPNNNDLRLNRTEDNTRMWVFHERTNVVVPSNIKYHAHANGNYQTNGSLVSQNLPYAGVGVVNSYIFHFDPTSGIRSASGSVDFSNPIYVITHPNNDLDISDGPFGIPSVQYANAAFSIADRGFDLAGANDNFSISNPSAGVWRLDFDVTASTGMDELRVIEYVSVPEPATLGAVAGALMLGLRRRR